MEEALIRRIWARAGNACEYCLMPYQYYPAPFQIDHVVSKQHCGATVWQNLALSCLLQCSQRAECRR